jgi:hypothetical protein
MLGSSQDPAVRIKEVERLFDARSCRRLPKDKHFTASLLREKRLTGCDFGMGADRRNPGFVISGQRAEARCVQRGFNSGRGTGKSTAAGAENLGAQSPPPEHSGLLLVPPPAF